MTYESLYKDFYWEQYGVDSLEYWFAYEGTPIFVGKAFKSPDAPCIRINVSRILRDYIWNDMPDFRPIDGDYVTHPDAMKKFDLYDGEGHVLEEYVVYYSYEDFNLPELTYRGIDGWADPRQKIFVGSMADSAWTQAFDVTEFFFNIWDVTVPHEGGLIRIPYETNMKDYQYYFVVPSGVTISSYGAGTLTVHVAENSTFIQRTFAIEVYDLDGNMIATANIVQEGDIPEFECTPLIVVPYTGGDYVIQFDTNIPFAELTYVLPSGFTADSFTDGQLVINVPPSTIDEPEKPVYFYWGSTLVGTTMVKQNAEYFICDAYKYLDSRGGTVTIAFDTNIPFSSITYTVPAGFTLVSYAFGSMVLSVGENTGSTYTKNVLFKKSGGAVVGTTTIEVAGVGDTYFTLEALEDGEFQMWVPSASNPDIFISKNFGEWERATTASTFTTLCEVVSGDTVRVKGSDCFGYHFRAVDENGSNPSTTEYNVYGNAMSLVYSDDFAGKDAFSGNNKTLFSSMFKDTGVIDAGGLVLPVKVLDYGWEYQSMFTRCTKLEVAPPLPATDVYIATYASMFEGCTSLTTAPSMRTNVLADGSPFNSMFSGCTGLVSASAIHASGTTFGSSACRYMFADCTSLTGMADITADSIGDYGCQYMYSGCTSLVNTVPLVATGVSLETYYFMFVGCTSLVTAPAISAKVLKNCTCTSMFRDCTSLVSGPVMEISAVDYNCCESMFAHCTSLVNSNITITATSAAERCFYNMYDSCVNLTVAPAITIINTSSYCYAYMYYGCTKINDVTCYVRGYSLSPTAHAFDAWLNGVSPTGTFRKTNWLTVDEAREYCAPQDWTITNVA